jgi:hypothetical protein
MIEGQSSKAKPRFTSRFKVQCSSSERAETSNLDKFFHDLLA